jgi:hypothetical protein
METRTLKPAPGKRVRKPAPTADTPPGWPAEDGEAVAMNSYWRRRLRDGDVVEVAAPKPAPKKPAKES